MSYQGPLPPGSRPATTSCETFQSMVPSSGESSVSGLLAILTAAIVVKRSQFRSAAATIVYYFGIRQTQ
jgi:hypothetical protein